jgi:hypothetical protein
MMADWSDEAIERAFAEWRAEHEGDVPPFGAVFAAAQAGAARRAAIAPWMRTAVAAAVLIVAGAGWLVLRPRAPRAPAVSLSEWRSPTAFLLDSPSDLLVKTVPNIPATTPELNALGVHAGRRRHS